jgi:SnoaL-like domain
LTARENIPAAGDPTPENAGAPSADANPTPADTAEERAWVSPEDLLSLMQLAADYWLRADGVRRLPVGELFADSGVLVLGSLRLSGRHAIESFFAQREAAQQASGRVTRHVATNHVATVIGPGRARMRSTVLVFSGEGSLPLPSAPPSGIADFQDICVRTAAAGWLFEERLGRSVFIGTGAPSFAR